MDVYVRLWNSLASHAQRKRATKIVAVPLQSTRSHESVDPALAVHDTTWHHTTLWPWPDKPHLAKIATFLDEISYFEKITPSPDIEKSSWS